MNAADVNKLHDGEADGGDSEEYTETFVNATVGWGAVGLPPREALPWILSVWIDRDEKPEAIAELCLAALAEEWPECQIAGLQGFVQLGERMSTLPQRDEIITAVVRARKHADSAVRVAATEVWRALMRRD